MRNIDIETETSTNGGLFFQRDLEFPSQTLSTPLKTTPVEYLTEEHRVRDSTRDIAEVHRQIDVSDLEAYRSDSIPPAIAELMSDLKYAIDSEVKVAFLEYTGDSVITPENMRTILNIQDKLANVLTMPLMPSITDALSPLVESDTRFDRSPWQAYYTSVRHFLENAKDYDKPIMAVLPPIGWSRRRELLREYEAENVQFYAIDFAGLKPTTEDCFRGLKDLMGDLATRNRNGGQVLYAVNYKRYHPVANSSFYPAEAIALISQGIDIAGETHIHRYGGGGDGEITDTKIFNPNSLGFDSVPLQSIPEQWNYQTTISGNQFASVGQGKQRELRKLVNSELLSVGLRKLRKAIQDGNERSFLESKSGYQGQVSSLAQEMVRKYEDATGPNLV